MAIIMYTKTYTMVVLVSKKFRVSPHEVDLTSNYMVSKTVDVKQVTEQLGNLSVIQYVSYLGSYN